MNNIGHSSLRKRVLKRLISSGYQITPDALDYLTAQSMTEKLVEDLIERPYTLKTPDMITLQFLKSTVGLESQATHGKKIELKLKTNQGRELVIQEDENVLVLRIHRPTRFKYRHEDATVMLDLDYNSYDVNHERYDKQEYIPLIDLTPISRCKNLMIFELNGLGLKSIDLEPLKHCALLEKFYFSGPYQGFYRSDQWGSDYVPEYPGETLDDLDLGPLSSCKNLTSITLQDMSLDRLDLEPLRALEKLRELRIINTGGRDGEKRIDLTPLENCSNLELLTLSQIKEIDFTPLAACKNLKSIELFDFQNLDFTPLSECTKLEEISITGIGLQQFDLSIFSNCTHLRKIDLSYRDARGINQGFLDLGPLAQLSSLEEIDLQGQTLATIDFGPLGAVAGKSGVWGDNRDPFLSQTGISVSYRPNYGVEDACPPTHVTLLSEEEYIKVEVGNSEKSRYDSSCYFYDMPIKIMSMYTIEAYYATLKLKEKALWKRLHLIHCVPVIINKPLIGLLDVEPDSFLANLLKTYQELNDLSKIEDLYVKAMCAQIDQGGTTIGIDLDGDISADILMHTDKILELREREMKDVVIKVTDGIVDYLPLWMTSYGSQILSATGKKLTDAESGLGVIEDALEELGYSLSVSKRKGSKPLNLSNTMMDYIRVMCNIPDDYPTDVRDMILDLPFF